MHTPEQGGLQTPTTALTLAPTAAAVASPFTMPMLAAPVPVAAEPLPPPRPTLKFTLGGPKPAPISDAVEPGAVDTTAAMLAQVDVPAAPSAIVEAEVPMEIISEEL